MNAYQPLNCDLHDYLEIACMHGYRVLIELLEGPSFEALALTTRTTASKEEFLVVQGEAGQQDLRLDRLQAITPLNAGASFGRIVLADSYCAS
ncbi:Rho-binding antiterminator [Ectopseudomonas alcaliphila]|uniref:Rho-binding antiterminator n=1 Tax=Ectopseudomonas alcaliphila TaxID=101564 RepID=UPI0027873B0D|nr:MULTISPECIES: Rho-binding antiterminator [Pseudomonas]MDP9941367.1 Rho-binding antiterminator [Pseudomonas sp. 3400]MDR7013586.1 Rho-binding antiterminator [Pseudomonas alcaliphila]